MVSALFASRRALVSDIFREIDEELRRDNLLKLLSRYWPYLAGVVVLVVAIAGGIAAWRQHQQSVREAASTRYAAALGLATAGKGAQSATLFASLARSETGYAQLAALQQAALLAKAGHKKQAIAIYDRIAAHDPHRSFRELAVLLKAMQQASDADPKSIIAELKPLTATGDPWRPSALELTALARLKAGDRQAARRIYKGLAVDPAAPPALRARAAQVAAALAS